MIEGFIFEICYVILIMLMILFCAYGIADILIYDKHKYFAIFIFLIIVTIGVFYFQSIDNPYEMRHVTINSLDETKFVIGYGEHDIGNKMYKYYVVNVNTNGMLKTHLIQCRTNNIKIHNSGSNKSYYEYCGYDYINFGAKDKINICGNIDLYLPEDTIIETRDINGEHFIDKFEVLYDN